MDLYFYALKSDSSQILQL